MNDQMFAVSKGAVTGADFIGREEELGFLDAAADAGLVKHISLHGLPHVGKSSLVMEWVHRREADGMRTASGRPLLVLSETTNRYAGFAPLFRRLARSLSREIRNAMRDDRLPAQEETLTALSDRLKEISRDPRREGVRTDASEASGDGDLTEVISSALHAIGGNGVRTVLILDEFEAVAENWTEEEFLAFAALLLDRRTELFCIAVSRPHISYITSAFERQIAPFVPHLLPSFPDRDVLCLLKRLAEAGGEEADLTGPQHAAGRNRMLYYCGRNPYLLTCMAGAMLEENCFSPDEIFARRRATYRQHFHDVVRFMLREEKGAQKSFSHVIKCYFGTSEDYADILKGYLPLGYIEREDREGMFAEVFDRFSFTDEETGEAWYYVTVSPAFIDYLYTDTLDEIRDVRDLLTGFIHSLRDITRRELEEVYPAPADWNEELLLRFRGHTKNDPSRAEYRAESNTLYAVWLPVKRSYIWCTMAALRSGQILGHSNSPDEPWIKDRREWIERNEQQMIDMASTSLFFAAQKFNEKKRRRDALDVMPVLDAISLTDHAAILKRYANRFVKYFGVLGDLRNDPEAFDLLNGHLQYVQDRIRNPISHYARSSFSPEEKLKNRSLCIYLLGSIYSCFADGRVAEKKAFRPETAETVRAAHEARERYRESGVPGTP
ncbi:MAG: ATP-binding protein [Lachnospiraceae bacterium]|nr:ATP-binding protein [Lachnospiraceae bacterium]